MEEGGRRRDRRVADRDGSRRVSLCGADASAVFRDREALLVVVPDNGADQGVVQRLARPLRAVDQGGDVRPSLSVQSQADRLRIVAQHVAEEFTDFCGVVFHICLRRYCRSTANGG
ncbi:hypothetical protein D3C72_2141620 [compost metagenome]